jgi:hypothetical protein
MRRTLCARTPLAPCALRTEAVSDDYASPFCCKIVPTHPRTLHASRVQDAARDTRGGADTRSMPDAIDDLRTERWCAGLRFTHARPIEPEERAVFEGLVQALGLRLWTSIACALVALIVPFLVIRVLPETLGFRWLDVTVVFLLVIAALVIPTVLLIHARRAWRERRAFREDLAAGEFECFEGALEAHDVLDEEQKQLLEARVLVPEAGAPQRLEVLPTSGCVMVRAPNRPPSWVRVMIAEVAVGPSYAMRVEMPPAMARIDGVPRTRFMRRTLNHHERAEIDTHIRHLRRPGMLVALWAVWLSVWAVACLFSPNEVSLYVRTRWPLVLVQVVVLAGVVMTYARALRLAGCLARDTHTGWALTLERMRLEPDLDGGEALPAAEDVADVSVESAHSDGNEVPAKPARCVEFLPHSRAIWNDGGRPARWRNLRRAA